MRKFVLDYDQEDLMIIERSNEIKVLLIFALKNIDAYEGEKFFNKINELYDRNLETLRKKYNYISLNEFCIKYKINSFYNNEKLTYESASNVLNHSTNAQIPIIKTLNSYRSWVVNYPENWLIGLIPAMQGKPSIEYCH